MKALIRDRYGPPDVLEVREVERPVPGEGEVLVRVVVVFDGTQSRMTNERENDGIQIFYADAGHTADSVIERLAAKPYSPTAKVGWAKNS